MNFWSSVIGLCNHIWLKWLDVSNVKTTFKVLIGLNILYNICLRNSKREKGEKFNCICFFECEEGRNCCRVSVIFICHKEDIMQNMRQYRAFLTRNTVETWDFLSEHEN
jgi:hypothetical protein